MDEDRQFNSLDCLGPPFDVDMAKITHNTAPATMVNVSAIYGIQLGPTPKVSSQKFAIHGFGDWMGPNIEQHPFLPARPGWPGLILQLDDNREEWQPEGGDTFRVVLRKEPNSVEYVGQYEMVRLGDITGDEWKKQSDRVRGRWTQIVGGGQLWHDTVACIALRRNLKKEPSTQELKRYTSKLTAADYSELAKDLKEEIDDAFSNQEEVIAVWGMKCVGYDYKFEKHLARSIKNIKPSSSGTAKKRKGAERNDDPVSEDEDEGKGAYYSDLDGPSPSTRSRIAKGKAKRVRYDWSGAKYHDDSHDEDYKPATS